MSLLTRTDEAGLESLAAMHAAFTTMFSSIEFTAYHSGPRSIFQKEKMMLLLLSSGRKESNWTTTHSTPEVLYYGWDWNLESAVFGSIFIFDVETSDFFNINSFVDAMAWTSRWESQL
jgi:hypothetical protein